MAKKILKKNPEKLVSVKNRKTGKDYKKTQNKTNPKGLDIDLKYSKMTISIDPQCLEKVYRLFDPESKQRSFFEDGDWSKFYGQLLRSNER